MTESGWEAVQRVLGEFLEVPAERRLESLAARNLTAETHTRVEQLLRALSDSEDFLERPPLPLGAPQPDGRLGQRLGPWRLEAVIGSGGMGTVYRGERDDGEFTQRAAIKVIAPGRWSPSMERRLREERQILARLEHPNVARLIDGGVAPDGSPYLVMEYVEGTPIDVWREQRPLDRRQQLRLFGQVCETVEFAHQNLIVHCDLKPANILVTREGAPKLLDFGIARFLSHEGLDGSSHPDPMTPDYASPEQLRGEVPGTASDIYSLGVVLHELLTGRRPYRLSGKSLDEVVATVCERPIDPPGSGAADLDAIVIKALAKEPPRRYRSVAQLGMDVRNYLAVRPVSARPDSVWYRARKLAVRRAIPLAAAFVLLGAVLGGFLSTSAESRRAQRRFNDVRRLAHSLLFDVYDSIGTRPGTLTARRVVASNAQQYLDSLARDTAGDGALVRDLAESYLRLGEVLGSPYTANLGDTSGAFANFAKAQSLLEPEAARNPGDAVVQDQLFRAHMAIGRVLIRQRSAKPAYVALRSAVAEAEAMHARRPADLASILKLSQAYRYMAEASELAAGPGASLDDLQQVLVTSRKSLEILDSQGAQAGEQWQISIAYACFRTGYALFVLGDRTADRSYYRQALEIRLRADSISRQLTSAHPERPDRREFVDGLANVSLTRWRCCGDLAGALRDSSEAMARIKKLSLADPENLELRRDVSNVYQNFAIIFSEAGRRVEALDATRKALHILEELRQLDPTSGENAAYLEQNRARVAALERAPVVR
jgi:eukaryotic-like serine/threonine-protein kinase